MSQVPPTCRQVPKCPSTQVPKCRQKCCQGPGQGHDEGPKGMLPGDAAKTAAKGQVEVAHGQLTQPGGAWGVTHSADSSPSGDPTQDTAPGSRRNASQEPRPGRWMGDVPPQTNANTQLVRWIPPSLLLLLYCC